MKLQALIENARYDNLVVSSYAFKGVGGERESEFFDVAKFKQRNTQYFVISDIPRLSVKQWHNLFDVTFKRDNGLYRYDVGSTMMFALNLIDGKDEEINGQPKQITWKQFAAKIITDYPYVPDEYDDFED